MNTKTALLFVIILDVLLFLATFSMASMNPDYNNIVGYDGFLKEFDNGNETYSLNSNVTEYLPAGEQVDTNILGFLTDLFTSVKGWFTTIGKGLTFLYEIVNGPQTLLMMLNAPPVFSFAIGAIWFITTLFLIISFLFGRE